MTTERGLNETPEERAARIQAAKERALAARQARESGQLPPSAAAAPAPAAEAEVTAEPVAAAPPPIEDDRPRTASGTLKRDPNEPKKDAPSTPEERAARVAAAKAAAAAAKAAREAGGGAVAARPAATAQAGAEAVEEVFEEAGPPDDGQLRTAKGTLKRDPNAPKKEPPATPEERAARIAAAKAAAAAAKERAAAAPATVSAQVAAAARPAARAATSADNAAFRQAYDAVMRPVPGAQPVLKAVAAARAERPGAATEFPMTAAMEAALAAFRQANPDLEFESFATPTDIAIVIDRRDVLPVMQRCKTHPATQMAFLRCISGVDLTPEGIEVVYQLKSLTTKHALTIKTLLPAHDQVVESVTSVWLGANWHERELMEMFGVRCAGHPDPRNLLLDDDLTIHPLLKAHPLADVEIKQGVNVF